jgi:hypothetical protein
MQGRDFTEDFENNDASQNWQHGEQTSSHNISN